MQEPNWDQFNAKFSGRQTKVFEWLCYLLFCQEHGIKLGINRFKNQPGIETDPIQVGDDLIGWQSKYLSGKPSDSKSEFIASIDTTKEHHPKLTKLVFYTNGEFSQDKKKAGSSIKEDIEKHAKSKGLTIEWKTASFFETAFVTKDNASLVKYFFSPDRSVHDLIAELNSHSADSILGPIRSVITFNGEIKIDRPNSRLTLLAALEGPLSVVLSGDGGVGKTALIKDIYGSLSETVPIFVFKAAEFNNLTHINDLFRHYGDFNAGDFLTAYPDAQTKCIVIDSAEKLADIDDPSVFMDFLRIALQNNWKLVFTTRRSYMDDLKIMLAESYGLGFQSIDINELDEADLDSLAEKHNFTLPDNPRMIELIKNPFYLNEYLHNYDSLNQDVSYSEFKKLLWDKHIANSTYKKANMHLKREEGFMELARRRVNQGSFSVDTNDIDEDALQRLTSAEVVGYDDKVRQHFITHDIYEEWALEKIVETEFYRTKDEKPNIFFEKLGDSLPIRRAFRNWLSSKLAENPQEVRQLIEQSIGNVDVPSFWRDEVLVSVLLSQHAESFFKLFEDKLLADDGKLLVRITFLLRIACKTIDENILKRLGIKQYKPHSLLRTMFTTPRGSGWDYLIKFIDEHKETLGLKNWASILAMLSDWNSKHQAGETTKHASKIALYYYEEVANNRGLGYRAKDLELKLNKVILEGSSEIKPELSKIIDEIVADKAFDHRSRYFSLAESMLGSIIKSVEVAQALPVKVIELARHLWMPQSSPGADRWASPHDIEAFFGISVHHQDYYPSSALQTPMTTLLQVARDESKEFLLDFANDAAAAYKDSELSENELGEVEIYLPNGKVVAQIASYRLWEMYRGTHVAPSVLESVHMAFEKWLLEYAKTASAEDLEKLCLHLLERSKSVSITAIVISVVLSQPYKLFNVASVLFKTRELFFYDNGRYIKDQTHKSSLEMLRTNFPQRDVMVEFFQDERIKACDDPHRKSRLEDAAISYQFFKPEGQSDAESKRMQKILWGIFDEHYKKLPKLENQTETDKAWRMYLARMDRRRMHPTAEKKDGQTFIKFNPELDSDLKSFSDNAMRENDDAQKYLRLNLWSNYRWKKEADKYADYPEYEKDIEAVKTETKELLANRSKEKDLPFLDASIPSYVCAVLVRDFPGQISAEDKEWCKEVIFEYLELSLSSGYDYQIGDGVEVAISSLPFLAGISDKDDRQIRTYLLATLLNRNPAGSSITIGDLALVTILHNLWKTDPSSADSILWGYLMMAPKYESLLEKVRQSNIKKKIYQVTHTEVLAELNKKHKKELETIHDNIIKYDDVKNRDDLDLDVIITAFELIPYGKLSADHRAFLKLALPRIASKLFDKEESYNFNHNMLEKLAHFILHSPMKDIPVFMKPFVDKFSATKDGSNLLEAFLSAADKLDRYEEFWKVWDLLYDKVVQISKGYVQSREKEIIRNYLLAWQYWKETAREWAMLKEREKCFYQKASKDMGSPITVLYSLAKVLYDIGSSYAEEGIGWIADLLDKNPDIYKEDLEVNTVYHLEHVMQRYISTNRHKIKTSPQLKKQIIKILDLLIEKASASAYVMRENIL